jgi:hypothetical protein
MGQNVKGEKPKPKKGVRKPSGTPRRLAKRARGIDANKIKGEDLARAGGAPEVSE